MIGFKLVTFTGGSKLEKRGRASGQSVIGKAEGDNSRDFDPEIYAAHGIVSRPSRSTRGIVLQLGNLLFSVASYTYGIDPPENEGACKVYSTDIDGVEKATHLLDSNGKHTFNGGTDFAVRFSALETAFNSLKSTFNSHVHSGVTTGVGSSAVTPTPSTADISGAKVSEVLLP